MAIAVGAAATGCAQDIDPPPNPCAPENTSEEMLRQAESTFHLVLPDDAADVSSATLQGLHSYEVTVVFRTTPAGLTSFLEKSHLAAPTPDPDATKGGQPLDAGTAHCGLDDGFSYSATLPVDTTYDNQWRSLAVDDTDPAAPRVLVVTASM